MKIKNPIEDEILIISPPRNMFKGLHGCFSSPEKFDEDMQDTLRRIEDALKNGDISMAQSYLEYARRNKRHYKERLEINECPLPRELFSRLREQLGKVSILVGKVHAMEELREYQQKAKGYDLQEARRETEACLHLAVYECSPDDVINEGYAGLLERFVQEYGIARTRCQELGGDVGKFPENLPKYLIESVLAGHITKMSQMPVKRDGISEETLDLNEGLLRRKRVLEELIT